MIHSYKDMNVYRESKELVIKVYKITDKFPIKETYNVISQLRRSVLSIPLNIAEGYGRLSREDLKRFIKIALGSSNEVEAILEISYELEYLSQEEYEELSRENDKVGKMLYRTIEKWQ